METDRVTPDQVLGRRPAAALAAVTTDDRRLYRLMLWGYFSLFPFTVMFIVMAALANSSAVVVYTVQSAISITVQTFSIYAIRQVLHGNELQSPCGAGQLEDFSASRPGHRPRRSTSSAAVWRSRSRPRCRAVVPHHPGRREGLRRRRTPLVSVVGTRLDRAISTTVEGGRHAAAGGLHPATPAP